MSELPPFPRFNLAAFLIPPIWGPAHGQWAGAVFLPMWLFADSIVGSAIDRGWLARVAAAGALAVTLALQAWFARNANPLAWRHDAGRLTPEQFLARERVWSIVSLPLAAALLGWAVYYRLLLAA